MRPTRVPWSEIAAVAAVYLAVSAHGERGPAALATGALLAAACALLPRRALSAASPVEAEATAIVGALAALAVASDTGAAPREGVLGLVRALGLGEALGLSTALAVAPSLRWEAFRRAAPPALLVGALAALGAWPSASLHARAPALASLPGAAAVLLALAFVHALRRPQEPVERARRTLPALGAALCAASLVLAQGLPPGARATLGSLGMLALVSGLTLGAGVLQPERTAPLVRTALSVALALGAGALAQHLLYHTLWVGVVVGLTTYVFLAPWVERVLRPAGGALLDACDEAEAALVRSEGLEDLAGRVLSPLRLAAQDLRAPAGLWVLEREETLRVDISGSARASRLSLEHQRALVTWLRGRPVTVFADVLRPHEVRRPELRPVVAALDELEAFAAVPFSEEGALSGVLLVPRGRRVEAPTYEEEVRLGALARQLAGVVSRHCALLRAHERTLAARSSEAEARRAEGEAQAARDRLRDRALAPLACRVASGAEVEWVGYSAAMRALRRGLDALEDGAVTALVAEPGAPAVAVARALHERHRPGAAPFVVADAAGAHPRDALALLVGDARWDPPTPGWLEHCHGGTLVLLDAPALGHDALAALAAALDEGRARRFGATEGHPVDLRVVLVSRRAPEAYDLPSGLLARARGRALRVPPLRERGEDLEALVLGALDRGCRVHGRAPLGITPDALAALRAYPFPGDVAELLALVAQGVQRSHGARVTLEDLPPQVRALVRDDDDDRDGDEDRYNA